MRLREIEDLLRAFVPAIKAFRLDGIQLPDGNPGGRLTNWRDAQIAVAQLSAIEALKPEVDACLAAPWGQLAGDPATVKADVYAGFPGSFQRLDFAADLLKRLVGSLLPAQQPATVSVKLPAVQDLDDLAGRDHRRRASGARSSNEHPVWPVRSVPGC